MMLLMWQKILKFNLYDLKCLYCGRHFSFKYKTSEVADIFRIPWFTQFHIGCKQVLLLSICLYYYFCTLKMAKAHNKTLAWMSDIAVIFSVRKSRPRSLNDCLRKKKWNSSASALFLRRHSKILTQYSRSPHNRPLGNEHKGVQSGLSGHLIKLLPRLIFVLILIEVL